MALGPTLDVVSSRGNYCQSGPNNWNEMFRSVADIEVLDRIYHDKVVGLSESCIRNQLSEIFRANIPHIANLIINYYFSCFTLYPSGSKIPFSRHVELPQGHIISDRTTDPTQVLIARGGQLSGMLDLSTLQFTQIEAPAEFNLFGAFVDRNVFYHMARGQRLVLSKVVTSKRDKTNRLVHVAVVELPFGDHAWFGFYGRFGFNGRIGEFFACVGSTALLSRSPQNAETFYKDCSIIDIDEGVGKLIFAQSLPDDRILLVSDKSIQVWNAKIKRKEFGFQDKRRLLVDGYRWTCFYYFNFKMVSNELFILQAAISNRTYFQLFSLPQCQLLKEICAPQQTSVFSTRDESFFTIDEFGRMDLFSSEYEHLARFRLKDGYKDIFIQNDAIVVGYGRSVYSYSFKDLQSQETKIELLESKEQESNPATSKIQPLPGEIIEDT